MRKPKVSFSFPVMIIAVCVLAILVLYREAFAEEMKQEPWVILSGDFQWKNFGNDPYSGNTYAALVAMFPVNVAPQISFAIENGAPMKGSFCSDGFVYAGGQKYRPVAMAFGRRTVANGSIKPVFLKEGRCAPILVHSAEINGKTFAVGFPECNNPTRLEMVVETKQEKAVEVKTKTVTRRSRSCWQVYDSPTTNANGGGIAIFADSRRGGVWIGGGNSTTTSGGDHRTCITDEEVTK
ncbi:hypothetical protein L0Y69_02620 [bacterium]|nr:hypothetical protein [bacterium]